MISLFLILEIVTCVVSQNALNHIFYLFRECHFKFILLDINKFYTPLSFSEKNLEAKSIHHINSSLNFLNGTVISAFQSAASKYSTSCLIHAYVLMERDPGQTRHSSLETHLNRLRKSGEWPHHMLFITQLRCGEFQTKFKTSTIQFYREKLPGTFARGLILDVHLKSQNDRDNVTDMDVNLVCIQCRITIHPVSVRDYGSTNELREFFSFQEKRGIYLMTYLSYLNGVKYACDITVALPSNFSVNYPGSVCVYKMLQPKFNITFYLDKLPENGTVSTQFFAHPTYFLGLSNYEDMVKTREYEWIPYDVRYSQFQFVNFQLKQKITLTILIKPYDLISWTLFYVTILFLIFLRCPKSLTEASEILVSLIAVFLEQSRKLERILELNGLSKSYQRMLRRCSWAYILMMLIFSGGFKGMIFSFLTKSIGTSWPISLLAVANDPAYSMFSNERIYEINETTKKYEPVPMLQNFFERDVHSNGTPGKDFPMEYVILKKAKVHDNISSTLTIIQGIIQDSEGRRNIFKIGDVLTRKFSWLHRTPEEFVALLKNFLPSLISSRPIVIPGFERITPWQISRNFLYEEFLSSLAWLEQTGFSLAFEKYRKMWIICNSLDIIKERINHVSYKRFQGRRQCVNKISGVGVSVDYGGSSEVRALSLQQCYGMLQVVIFGLAFSTLAFSVEYISICMYICIYSLTEAN